MIRSSYLLKETSHTSLLAASFSVVLMTIANYFRCGALAGIAVSLCFKKLANRFRRLTIAQEHTVMYPVDAIKVGSASDSVQPAFR